ncbi:methyltransferase [Mycobacterium phage Xeno]|uniref:DNA methylase n=1 Tax=Mycobacterium phage Xeno TaxID=1821538 RepID=A0A142K7R0_9CAUD|nr:methyltransferase [Mycobacterium phage Xeno]AMS02143.1 DNA methylase [Mycobacterium phage Xeno]
MPDCALCGCPHHDGRCTCTCPGYEPPEDDEGRRMNHPYYQDDQVTLYHGDCLHVLAELPDRSVDAVVCDPPYGLEFMGKEWDAPWRKTSASHARARERRAAELDDPVKGKYIRAGVNAYEAGKPFQQWCAQWAAECLRVLKPGGHLLAFGGSRTWHRLAAAIEDAGFEVRDSIAWLYGSGFPKSLDVSKAIDKAAGAEREVVGPKRYPDGKTHIEAWPGGENGHEGWQRPGAPKGEARGARNLTAPATSDAAKWQGWGTALKPAFEPIVVARKPLAGTVAANVLEHGTGALNIDACRIPAGQDYRDKCASVVGLDSNRNGAAYGEWTGARTDSAHEEGRWPTNVVLDDAQAAELDRQSGHSRSRINAPTDRTPGVATNFAMTKGGTTGYEDEGGASRFFPVFRYEAKAPGAERPSANGVAHPTVKPLDLMRWLVRLVTPPNGVVLDPFAGSGTTAEACIHEHKRCITIEREADYLPLIVARLSKPIEVGFDFGDAAS